jgi:hypothetical protein
MEANLEPQWPEDDGSGSCGESRINRIASSHGDGEHYEMKLCVSCRAYHPVSDFAPASPDFPTRDGLQYCCRKAADKLTHRCVRVNGRVEMKLK